MLTDAYADPVTRSENHHPPGLENLASDLHLSLRDIQTTIFVTVWKWEMRARLQTNVRVRSRIDPTIPYELGWPHLIEENEGTNHLALGTVQRTPDFETAEIPRAG